MTRTEPRLVEMAKEQIKKMVESGSVEKSDSENAEGKKNAFTGGGPGGKPTGYKVRSRPWLKPTANIVSGFKTGSDKTLPTL